VEKLKIKKIAFLGLDNGGKSTILNILEEKYSLISNQTPTVKIERHKMENIFGCNIINWDVPGQRKLREKYLNDIECTLLDTDLIIYVIDIQDYRRILESITFFKKIIKKLHENNLNNIQIFVFCHKFDPDLVEDEACLSNIRYVREKINSIIPNSNIKFFNTTIYDRWTIFFAFSKAFMILMPESKEQKIRKILEEFALTNNFNSVLLMNEKNIIINEYSADSFSSEVINSLALTLNTLYDIATEKSLGNQIKINLLSGIALLISIQLDKNVRLFLLGFIEDNNDFKIEGVDKVINGLRSIHDISDVK